MARAGAAEESSDTTSHVQLHTSLHACHRKSVSESLKVLRKNNDVTARFSFFHISSRKIPTQSTREILKNEMHMVMDSRLDF